MRVRQAEGTSFRCPAGPWLSAVYTGRVKRVQKRGWRVGWRGSRQAPPSPQPHHGPMAGALQRGAVLALFGRPRSDAPPVGAFTRSAVSRATALTDPRHPDLPVTRRRLRPLADHIHGHWQIHVCAERPCRIWHTRGIWKKATVHSARAAPTPGHLRPGGSRRPRPAANRARSASARCGCRPGR